ncbi:GNAT family N-acetyltransferase [Pseudonocardia sp.]|uniref:GNAT family N-acetyltransferase n=1 Tax=Pseudonocardia sp. TaxID=60912 RepID=UPI0026343228|nr:GNAT family N-acetyltransferase [Pseudonocardia sp.]
MIHVRACTANDAADFRRLALAPQVTARIGVGAPWSRATADARFRRGMAACGRGEGMWWLAHEPQDADPLVGLVVAEVDHLAEIEIGIWLAPGRWGRGHGRELLAVVLPVVRTRFPGVTPTAYANVDHPASARMLTASGFHPDGTLIGRYGTEVTRFVAGDPTPT